MQSYLSILQHLLDFGDGHADRTGVGTRSVFGYQWTHYMGDGFPLLTTKQLPMRLIFNELAWFLSGSTNINDLPEDTRHWWRPWADEHGDLGPIYGRQLRDSRSWRQEPGDRAALLLRADQLEELVDGIVNTPNSRRLLMSTWSSAEVSQMKLPPCHGLVIQVKCHGDRGLSLHMYQRSADSMIGIPVNIASYALLLEMLAKVTGREAEKLIISFGDLHLYNNHVDQAKLQLDRMPRALPELRVTLDGIDPSLSAIKQLLAIRWENIKLIGYDPHPKITAPVAV